MHIVYRTMKIIIIKEINFSKTHNGVHPECEHNVFYGIHIELFYQQYSDRIQTLTPAMYD